MRQLILETNTKPSQDRPPLRFGDMLLSLPPFLNADYWLYRVQLWKEQYIVAFPKHAQIGIGFAQEEFYDTNLPARCSAQEIYEHIKRNKKYAEIPDSECVEAIKLIQETIEESKDDPTISHMADYSPQRWPRSQ